MCFLKFDIYYTAFKLYIECPCQVNEYKTRAQRALENIRHWLNSIHRVKQGIHWWKWLKYWTFVFYDIIILSACSLWLSGEVTIFFWSICLDNFQPFYMGLVVWTCRSLGTVTCTFCVCVFGFLLRRSGSFRRKEKFTNKAGCDSASSGRNDFRSLESDMFWRIKESSWFVKCCRSPTHHKKVFIIRQPYRT